MRHLLRTTLWVWVLLAGLSTFSHATITNGDFSNGLTGWTSTGSVAVENGAAVLRDGADGYSSLLQNGSFAPGLYQLSFDYMIGSMGQATQVLYEDGSSGFTAPDLFAASLYFSPDPEFLSGIELFQVSGSPEVVLGQWNHFSLVFENQFTGIVPTFELFDGNFITGDSAVFLDNVEVSVPEPGTWLLLAIGLLVLIGIQSKRVFARATHIGLH